VTVTTADAAMTTNKNVGITQIIEGLRIADLAAGLATARAVTLRFGIKAPAGTYCVALRNGGVTRAYIGECVVSPAQANIDSVMALALTMDTTGTWASDTTAGLNISWTLMCGPTYQTPAGVWTAGNFLASANQFNFMGTAGNVFELFDVGLYQGSTGTAPAFQVPDFASDRTLCQRYFWRMGGPAYLAIGSNGLYSDANQILMADYFAAMLLNMRTAPVPATTSLIGTQGTDWAVVSSGGVNQTGFSVAYNTSAAGMASVSKTSHGLVNASLQLLTANGALIRNARM
jgi:hypothetical protein